MDMASKLFTFTFTVHIQMLWQLKHDLGALNTHATRRNVYVAFTYTEVVPQKSQIVPELP